MNNTFLIVCLSVSALICCLLPVALLIVWRRKTGARLMPALVGAVIFPVFALGLEQLCHSLVLNLPIMKTSAALYVLYGSLAAGVFEETGRWTAFRFLLRRHRGRETSVTYGIGHGGIESILVAGISMVSLLVAAVTLATGGQSALESLFGQAGAQTMVATLTSNPPALFLVSGLERAIAITLHISLSVLVFRAVREKRPVFYVLAVLLHAAVDCFAALYSVGVFRSILLVEALVLIATLFITFYAVRIYRAMSTEDSDAEAGGQIPPVPEETPE